jgi:hypothetical protein
LNNLIHDTAGISELERGNTSKTKLMRLQQTVRANTLETCIEEQINLSSVPIFEIT